MAVRAVRPRSAQYARSKATTTPNSVRAIGVVVQRRDDVVAVLLEGRPVGAGEAGIHEHVRDMLTGGFTRGISLAPQNRPVFRGASDTARVA